MKRYLLDSGVVSDYASAHRGIPQRCEELTKNGNIIGICTPVLGELLGGLEGSQSRDENLKRFYRIRDRLSMWTFDEKAAIEYGRLWGVLIRKGRLMQKIDVQIAAIAMSLGRTTVVTYDSDLSAVPGLSVENWLESKS